MIVTVTASPVATLEPSEPIDPTADRRPPLGGLPTMCRSAAASGGPRRCRAAFHDPADRAALRAHDAARRAHHRARDRLAAALRDGPADAVPPLRAALLVTADRLRVTRDALPAPRRRAPAPVPPVPPVPPTFLAPPTLTEVTS